MKIDRKALFEQLPPEWHGDLLPGIQAAVARSPLKLVVLDDDPTGTQTMRDISVLTRWEAQALVRALQEPDVTVYILTNSRSQPLERAQEMNREIVQNLIAASQTCNRPFSVVSRSDSTLRGHFPGEVDALVGALNQAVDGILILPFFEEGGRYTIDDIHYVAEGDQLIPAGETEYARDATFGYRSSNLREWVCEKYGGSLKVDDVSSLSLEVIRRGGPAAVAAILEQLEKGHVCVVNCASYKDMEVFVAGLLDAEEAGKRFVYRSAASFVRVRSGLAGAPLLSGDALRIGRGEAGGLIVAGSYIQKSSQQISQLLEMPGVYGLEISVHRLLDAGARLGEIERVSSQADRRLAQGMDVLVYTSRNLMTGSDAGESLRIGQSVSGGVVHVVRAIQTRPAWVIAKGGITASDVATKGLEIWHARVLGQVLPGVPVWQSGDNSRWPGMIYIVFPGNVGGPDAIADVVKKLRQV